MSRKDDISKSNELLKKYGVKEAKEDLEKTKADNKALKIMNSIGNPTNYAEAVAFGLTTSEYLGKKKNIKFLKSLPQGADDSEYEKLPQKTKNRLLDIAVSLKEAMEEKTKEDDETTKSLNEKKEIIQEAKLIVDVEEVVTSILMVSDLSRQRE